MPPHYDNEDDDYDECDQEMVALVSRTDEDEVTFKASLREKVELGADPTLDDLRSRSRLRSRSVRRIRRFLSNHDGGVEPWIACGVVVVILMLLVGVLWPNSGGGDESSEDHDGEITQWKKLKLKNINHWCLDPNSRSCEEECVNPLQPKDRIGHKTWGLAHDGNIRDAYHAENVDVVFLGDSITEGWRGMKFGIPIDHKKDNLPVYEALFSREKGADFEGLALGIAGDRSPHLLWRIQNGEVPDQLQPSVWWLLIGTNDFLRSDYCSPEVVLMGIKRVVEEMQQRRPGTFIVVNSLLPRSTEEMHGQLTIPKHPDKDTVWTGISEVNRQLRIYCEKSRNVLFFDATEIFLRKQSDSAPDAVENLYIPQSLMYDYLHPTPEGYEKWGKEIVLALHRILDADAAANGRKPLPTWFGLKSPSKPDLNAPDSEDKKKPEH